MGMDAQADIWVGLNVSNWDDMEMLKSKMPEEILEKVSSYQTEPTIDDMTLKFFNTGDDDVGFGVSLMHHDWDGGPKAMDLFYLARQADDLKAKVAEVFQSWGIQQAPSIWIDTDYS